ncbi:MAG: hypothetical protein ABSA90_11745 [Xanthobacteraceae bacterium]|jgi:hypothetical protein
MSPLRTTRRTIVSGAAAAVASIGITDAAIASTTASADSELLELGRAFEPILAEWAEIIRTSDADQAQFERAVLEATGISFDDAPAPGRWDSAPDSYWRSRDEILKRLDTAESDLVWERSLTEIDAKASPIARAIFALPARTLAGLAVKARVAAFVHSDWWRPIVPDDADRLGTRNVVDLLENICALAGVPSLAAQVGSIAQNREIAKC